MTGQELLELLDKAYRRSYLIGTPENGVIAALDQEGRFFTVVNGKVLNRVVPSAIINRSNKNSYQNPGGDALWPAPEGTCFGYEYPSGSWRVPPSITGASWEVLSCSADQAVIRAEIDLVNNLQTGIPCEFERHVKIEQLENCLVQNVTEIIRYIGKKTLHKGEFLLAPWSLCQFDSGGKGKVTMLLPAKEDIWDLYEPSKGQRRVGIDGMYVVTTETEERFQLGLGANVPWIEYMYEGEFRVRRYTDKLTEGHSYIDIADLPPDRVPSEKGVKFSVYCDPSGFMEIEACGGCPIELRSGTELCVQITTEYEMIKETSSV